MIDYTEPLREKNAIIETIGLDGKTSIALHMQNGDAIYIDTLSSFHEFKYGRKYQPATFLTTLVPPSGIQVLLYDVKVILVEGIDAIVRAMLVPSIYIPIEDNEIDVNDPENVLMVRAYSVKWTHFMHEIYRDADPDMNAFVAAVLLGLGRTIPGHSYCDSIEMAMEQSVSITQYVARIE